MRQIITILLILSSIESHSQVRIYNGHIDKYPVQLVTNSFSDGDIRAVYCYNEYDTPIIIHGRHRDDSLILLEINEENEARFEFAKFNPENTEISGKWIGQEGQSILDVNLTKLIEFGSFDNSEFENIELIQAESTKDHYFKLLIAKKEGEDIRVTGVRIYEKETDRLTQEFDMDCEFRGLDNISVVDYNFDGIDDFSVFESSYWGPNTTSVYVLKDPESDEYFISEISGISLEFDFEAKLIYEHNQCCAGRGHMNAIYKLVDNKMVLIEQRCFEYDEETEDLIEKDCN